MQRVLIFGATSAIAEATARRLAATEVAFFLVGRNPKRLAAIADDLGVRTGNRAHQEVADLDELDRHPMIIDRALAALGGLDLALIAHGALPDQRACQQDVGKTMDSIHTNALSAISLSSLIANRFEHAGHGTLVVIGSVAGERGRQSNYVYGAAKGMLAIFLQGLRNRLTPAGCQVITIKPGFVDTPMTKEFAKGVLWAQPDDIARGIVRAIKNKSDVVYLPWFWRGIMAMIGMIPEWIFKRMRL
ncbi:Oxidoreductase, short-chain dehydrogenase/reductase family [Candidatus Accumulibacter aalborgensis]|uniref:Oxidoreductase, short-chain dehydrogenase/reductase family n=1 Tax=Candidatus Accumulibacter aalborgensis TaxID=1860102 RepID=A0A1A8XFJ1_9PROT|nr:SDR family oxidoreductase [Candidatus Accumulibacter aalborgensis]SBT03481.1 Oxidoreductase, short-chain dehydrogenase/reductase family [Candidatus Accumulibacter aalborgensis]